MRARPLLLCATLGCAWACSQGIPEGTDTGSGSGGTGVETGGSSFDGSSASNGGISSGASTGVGGAASSGGSAASGGAGDPASAGGMGSSGTGAENGTGGFFASGGSTGELPFLIGADITRTIEDEYWGATYTDGGQKKSLEQILVDHGFNAARIDTFVDPSASGGYAENLEQPFRNLAQTITLAKRIKAVGMHFLLDLHLSDTWTNPAAQTRPAAWANLSLGDLEEAVHDYIANALTQLIQAGARPDLVQVGNEVTNGFLWDSGRIQNDDFSNFARLLKAGTAAVREIDPSILVMLHIEKCNNSSTTRWWLDGVIESGVDFDILGQSCYGPAIIDGQQHHPGYQGTPQEWRSVFTTIATEYPNLKFAIAEYSAEARAAGDVMFDLPDKRGIGTFNWDPTRFYETHPNVPIFQTGSSWSDYIAIPEQMSIYEKMAEDFKDR